MCGRYTLAKPIKSIKKHFDPVTVKCEHSERYNIAPGQNTPVITLQNNQRELRAMRWGFIPPWSKNIKSTKILINARSEIVHKKPTFRNSFQAHRCLVPADGFIEWKVEGRKKVPHYIFLKPRSIFAFAGIWAKRDKMPSPPYSYSILTTQANTTLASIHERMPVILEPANYKLWLGSDTDSRSRNVLPSVSEPNHNL
jgi:putative SOS response-associated peptidase YedK